MFNNSGLSLNQAPPIDVVLRLFFSGSLFAIAGSIMLLFWHDKLNLITSPETLIVVHTFTIGFMASFMLGALFQMMPVLCGVHIKAPVDLSIRVMHTLNFGLISLLFGFYNNSEALYVLAIILLGFAFFASAFSMIRRLLKINHSNSSRGMLIAVISLALTIIFAILMLLFRVGINLPLNYLALKSIHFNFGVFGWISILILSVSFQVIEMFYVTPKYNSKYAKYTPLAIFSLLLIYMVATLFNIDAFFIPYILALILAIHASITLVKFKQKKRPVNDASIWFWIAGMSFLILFFISFLLNFSIVVVASFFAFFAISVIFAMSYKIVPFLVWFHLNAKGYFEAPMMHEVISPKYAKVNFWIYLVGTITFILSLFAPIIFYIAIFSLLSAFSMLSFAIYNGWQKYNYTIENKKRFNFNT